MRLQLGILLVVIFWASYATIDKTSQDTIVYEKLGTMLHKLGVVSMDADDILVSVFVRMELPKLPQFSKCQNNSCSVRRLCNHCPLTVKCGHTSYDKHWLHVKFEEITKTFITNFEELKNPSFVKNYDSSSSGRNKRMAGLFGIGLGVLNLAFTGISTYTLNRQINSLKSDSSDFKMQLHKVQNDLIKFENKVIHVFDAYAKDINHRLYHMSCKIESEIETLAIFRLIDLWTDKLRTIFKYPLLGSTTGTLTPDLISIVSLREILSSHDDLQNLIYSERLENFYSTTKITLAEASLSNNAVYVHYVLNIPRIFRSTTLPLYITKSVPLTINGSCALVNVPKYIFIKEGNLHELNHDNCKIQSPMSICSALWTEYNKDKVCFNTPETCTVSNTVCAARQIYDQSGILVGGSAMVNAIRNTPTKDLVNLVTNEVKTLFMPWANASKVQVEGTQYSAPQFAPLHINI